MNRKICKRCGKTCNIAVYELEPLPELPEVKKTLYFCSEECLNIFLGTIKSARRKANNKRIRAALEKADRHVEGDDVGKVFLTLTKNEKEILAAVGLGTILGTCGNNLRRFYGKLKSMTKGK